MDTAWVGVGGTLSGAVLGFGGSWLQARSQRKAEDRRHWYDERKAVYLECLSLVADVRHRSGWGFEPAARYTMAKPNRVKEAADSRRKAVHDRLELFAAPEIATALDRCVEMGLTLVELTVENDGDLPEGMLFEFNGVTERVGAAAPELVARWGSTLAEFDAASAALRSAMRRDLGMR